MSARVPAYWLAVDTEVRRAFDSVRETLEGEAPEGAPPMPAEQVAGAMIAATLAHVLRLGGDPEKTLAAVRVGIVGARHGEGRPS